MQWHSYTFNSNLSAHILLGPQYLQKNKRPVNERKMKHYDWVRMTVQIWSMITAVLRLKWVFNNTCTIIINNTQGICHTLKGVYSAALNMSAQSYSNTIILYTLHWWPWCLLTLKQKKYHNICHAQTSREPRQSSRYNSSVCRETSSQHGNWERQVCLCNSPKAQVKIILTH